MLLFHAAFIDFFREKKKKELDLFYTINDPADGKFSAVLDTATVE